MLSSDMTTGWLDKVSQVSHNERENCQRGGTPRSICDIQNKQRTWEAQNILQSLWMHAMDYSNVPWGRKIYCAYVAAGRGVSWLEFPNTLIFRTDYLQTTIFESRAGILYSVETELLEGLWGDKRVWGYAMTRGSVLVDPLVMNLLSKSHLAFFCVMTWPNISQTRFYINNTKSRPVISSGHWF